MSAWDEIVSRDSSDEWLDLCSRALIEIQAVQRQRSAGLLRKKITEWEGMSDEARRANRARESAAVLVETDDSLLPESGGS